MMMRVMLVLGQSTWLSHLHKSPSLPNRSQCLLNRSPLKMSVVLEFCLRQLSELTCRPTRQLSC